MDIQQMKHDLRRDIQNIMSVLKIINSELKVEDPEIKTLLQMSVDREEGIIKKLSLVLDKNERGLV
jgi:hypothetical protein